LELDVARAEKGCGAAGCGEEEKGCLAAGRGEEEKGWSTPVVGKKSSRVRRWELRADPVLTTIQSNTKELSSVLKVG